MKVLVIGDSCIDEFIYGSVERICPEAPVPVLKYRRKEQNKGMAANVQNNFIALGGKADLITNTTPIIKSRYVDEASNQMIVRLDYCDECDPINWGSVDENSFDQYDGIIISDYNKGFLTEDDIRRILTTHVPTFLDTKKVLGNWCRLASFIKVNEKEWEASRPFYDGNNVVVTLGVYGACYKGENFPPVKQEKIFSVCGAGDTFLAAFAYSMLKCFSVENAIHFANKCAGKVIQKRGVSTV